MLHQGKATRVAIAALLGMFIIMDSVEAQKPRSPIERRQRPNAGFWESSTRSGNYSGTRSAIRQPQITAFTPNRNFSSSIPQSQVATVPMVQSRGVAAPVVTGPRYVAPNAPIANTIVPNTTAQDYIAPVAPTASAPVANASGTIRQVPSRSNSAVSAPPVVHRPYYVQQCRPASVAR